jgi:ketosteroid isomerase-like protein
MHTLKVIAALCAVLWLPLCAQQPSDSAAPSDIQSEIRAVLDRQSIAWNKGDIDGYMQGYWQSDSMLFTSGGRIQQGWLAARDKYKAAYSTKEAMGVLTFSEVECHLLSGEAAWIFGRWKLERAKDKPHGVFTLVMRKFPQGWKIIHDHTSAESPPPVIKKEQ